LFFSSKNAVKYYFKLGYQLNGHKIACIGKATARALKAHVKNIDFVGDNIDIRETAQQFSELLGPQTCLFPISNISNRTIQKAFENVQQTHDLVVYNTEKKKDLNIPDFDVVIFTSPSSVRSYFASHKVDKTKKIIAIGPSTGNELAFHKISKFDIPTVQGELGMIDLLRSFNS
jgi:uroporphyrinogen-III synthase